MKILLIFIAALVFIDGCSSDITSPTADKFAEKRSGKNIVYLNSFESDSDTIGWRGLTPEMFINEASPDGGSKSLYIGGGCIQPAGSFTISIIEAGYYNISLWEKTPDTGGVLTVIIDDGKNKAEKSVPLTSKTWKYHSTDNLYFPANCNLTLELNVGGFVFASANIDELAIKKAD